MGWSVMALCEVGAVWPAVWGEGGVEQKVEGHDPRPFAMEQILSLVH